MSTATQVRDELHTAIKSTLDSVGVTGEYGIASVTRPNAPSALVDFRHATGSQTSIGGGGEVGGTARYTRLGILSVRLRFDADQHHPEIDPIADAVAICLERFRSSLGTIIRNVSRVDVGLLDGWKTVDVIADVEYDEFH